MNALVEGLPPGDWATWFGSIAISLSFLFLAYGTVKQARDSRRQTYLDESAQARLVGATLSTLPSPVDNQTSVQIIGTNASSLSVKKIGCFVITGAPESEWIPLAPVYVQPPGDFEVGIRLQGIHPMVAMVMGFQDDAGITWRKYDGRRLTEIKKGQDYLHGLETERARKKHRPPVTPPSGGALEAERKL